MTPDKPIKDTYMEEIPELGRTDYVMMWNHHVMRVSWLWMTKHIIYTSMTEPEIQGTIHAPEILSKIPADFLLHNEITNHQEKINA